MGLWIDHRKAIIVTVTDKGEELALIVLQVEKQLRRFGDSPLKGSYEAKIVPADDSRQRAHTGRLNIFYQAVIASLRDAESILIFGPGEAKGELQERLEECNLCGCFVGVETVDKMTDPQLPRKFESTFRSWICQWDRNKTIKKPPARDRCRLRSYKHRWIIERLFA